MKKLLFISLLLPGFIVGNSSLRTIINCLITPIESADKNAEDKLAVLHSTFFKDKSIEWGDKAKNLRIAFPNPEFPNHNPIAVDQLAKAMILQRHQRLQDEYKRLRRIKRANKAYKENKPFFSSQIDYEKVWQQQPLHDRFWWTMCYRHPYTIWLSLVKWTTEIAVAMGAIYGLYRLGKKIT